MSLCQAYSSENQQSPLKLTQIERRECRANDVQIKISYCGVCHSDLHQVKNEWGFTLYPCVPGHEIVGHVCKIGKAVTRFKVGDRVGVGCMVDSCRHCKSCNEGLEQYCEAPNGFIATYNSEVSYEKLHTFGGYSESIVVDESFVLKVPKNLELAAVAPLLCAGITTYSPLKNWNMGPGKKVGIIGLGGLGHMAVKIAHAMRAHVTIFTRSREKAEDAKRLGADEVIVSQSSSKTQLNNNQFDFILNTVSAEQDINVYLSYLKRDGTLVQVGAPERPLVVNVFSLIDKRRNLAGSLIGGIAQTQEMLDFCGENNITADIQLINIQNINEAFTSLLKGEVKYRYVIDMSSI